MIDTPAKIMSSAYLGLGKPEAELLQEGELAEIVLDRLEYFYEGVRSSGQNLMTKRTPEFTLAAGENSKDITAIAADILVPLWVERKVDDNTWQFVETVNLDTLADRRLQGIPAVSFSGLDTITAEFSYRGEEVISTYRVMYSPSISFTNKDETLSFPSQLLRLVTASTKLYAIDQIVLNASKFIDRRPELGARINAYQQMKPGLLTQIEEWTKHYDSWRRKSRGSQKARNRTDVLETLRADRRYRWR